MSIAVNYFLLTAKVAAQIVDYYNMALNVLNHGGPEEGMVIEAIGVKTFKVNCSFQLELICTLCAIENLYLQR